MFSDDNQGYVQDAFEKDGGITDGSKTAMVLCGLKEMCTACKDMAAAKGVAADKVLLNF